MKRFVSGGTVQASNGIYIPRAADEELYQLCIEGDYAAVLTARQRGKSSLMANVTHRLRQQGIHVASVDISPYGSEATADNWYFTILEIIASSSNLNLDIDLNEWWESQSSAYPLAARRFSLFFEKVALTQLEGKVVIFIDEIDKTFTLRFTDDFFIGIRSIYNQRSQDEIFQRLSFVLLGVASPTELIKSKEVTPYNIGKQIELTDFTHEELEIFQQELIERLKIKEESARNITYSIHSWTEGHPYLTYRLFKEVADRKTPGRTKKEWDSDDIEDLVTELFLRARTTSDNNIIEVKQRMEFAKLVEKQAVELYYRILHTPLVYDDDAEFEPKTFLKLAGVVATKENRLEIRNRVYQKVVGIEWFEENYKKHFNKPLDELKARYETRSMPVSSQLEEFRAIEQESLLSGPSKSTYDDFDFDDDLFADDEDDLFGSEQDDFAFGDNSKSTNSNDDDFVSDDEEYTRAKSILRPKGKTIQSLPSQTAMQRRRSIKEKSVSNAGYSTLKTRVQNKLMAELDQTMDTSRKDEIRRHIEELFNAILAEESMVLSRAERQRLFESIVADILGFGPLEILLADESVTTIMVNGPRMVFAERKGQTSRTNVTFDSDEHVLRIIDRIITPLGSHVNEQSPSTISRLPDGSRVHIVIRPVALCGPSITIRKFEKDPLQVADLIRFGSMTPEIAEFLRACTIARINTLIVGSIGSGKQTLMNVLSSFVPNDERVITVERIAELQLQKEHVLPLEARPNDMEGNGNVTIKDLARMAIHMNPDRIVFGNLEMSDVGSYLDAAARVSNSFAVIQATNAETALNFLEIGALQSSPNLTMDAARTWISTTTKLIVVTQKLLDGSRKIMQIAEIMKLGPGRYGFEPIFQFEQTGFENGKIVGRTRPTGKRPSFSDIIENSGIHLPPSTFGVGSRR